MSIKFHRYLRGWVLLFVLMCANCAHFNGAVQRGESSSKAIARTTSIVYVALGDSTGIGLGARNGGGYVERLFGRIQKVDPGSRLINLSMSRATTSDVLAKELNRFSETHATLVTLSIGVNDLAEDVSEEKFAKNYDMIVSRLKEAKIPIIVTNLPDIASSPAMVKLDIENVRSRVEQFNRRIEEIAKRQGVLLVDLYQSYGSAVQPRSELFSADGFHPSDLGYELWAEAMWPTVERAIGE
jgi:lysophospholipase L1-like esterase